MMATITTNFGTVTAVVPSSFAITLTEQEAALIMAEGAQIFTPLANQTTYAHTFALFQKLQAAQVSTAPIDSNGTAPPALMTFNV